MIGLGVGVNRRRFAGGFAGSYSSRVIADGGTIEALDCVAAASSLLQSASLLIIPSGYKGGKLYAEIPTNGNGDLTWSRNSVANRTQSDGNIGSVAANVPRLSYMYGSCPALLLEPQRTNVETWSDDFSNAAWTKINCSITANATTSPDGSTNADKIIENSVNGIHYVFNATATLSVAATLSVYAKADTRTQISLQLGASSVIYNLSNGTIVSGSGGSIQSVGNGWYRCSITQTPLNINAMIYIANAGSTTYQGNGTSGLFIYGAQLEAGAYPTTYIPTTSATSTRIADSFSRNNIYTNGLISASGGTWYIELRNNIAYTRDNAGETLGIGDTNSLATNCLGIRNGVGTSRLQIIKRVSTSGTTLFTTTTDIVKIAIKWNGTTADVFVNGIKGVSATAFATTNMEFLTGWGQQQPIFIQQMALYPTPLSDAQCEALTT